MTGGQRQTKTDEYRQAQPIVEVFTHTIARYGAHNELRTTDCAARNYKPHRGGPHECQHRATQE